MADGAKIVLDMTTKAGDHVALTQGINGVGMAVCATTIVKVGPLQTQLVPMLPEEARALGKALIDSAWAAEGFSICRICGAIVKAGTVVHAGTPRICPHEF